jgi:hypothetical protein
MLIVSIWFYFLLYLVNRFCPMYWQWWIPRWIGSVVLLISLMMYKIKWSCPPPPRKEYYYGTNWNWPNLLDLYWYTEAPVDSATSNHVDLIWLEIGMYDVITSMWWRWAARRSKRRGKGKRCWCACVNPNLLIFALSIATYPAAMIFDRIQPGVECAMSWTQPGCCSTCKLSGRQHDNCICFEDTCSERPPPTLSLFLFIVSKSRLLRLQ